MLLRACRERLPMNTASPRRPWISAISALLLADAAINAFAQQVCVTAVPGVLLDPMDQQFPDGDTPRSQTLPQIRMLGHHRVHRSLLASEVCIRSVDHRRF